MDKIEKVEKKHNVKFRVRFHIYLFAIRLFVVLGMKDTAINLSWFVMKDIRETPKRWFEFK